MKIRVTESHIERGRRCHSTLCPLALAFYEATGESWHVGSASAVRDRDNYRFWFPDWLARWVLQYDDSRDVSPVEFEVPPREGVGA